VSWAEYYAAIYEVPVDLVEAIIDEESGWNPSAISNKGAVGLMQLMPHTATRLGVLNVFDPQQNINGGAQYLHELLLRYNNDLILSLAAYNSGPERVEHYGRRVPPIRETQSYVRRVAKTYADRKASKASLAVVAMSR
jgi:soluble lytic murein transglycosylase-like protein